MVKRVLAITGSYREGGITDAAVAAVLAGARGQGAETEVLRLADHDLRFCTNCRACTQEPGPSRGACVQQDGLAGILAKVEAADALVLASPVNFYNATALFRRFLERLLGFAYWPWGARRGPGLRDPRPARKAVLVASAAMPGPLLPLGTGAPKALKVAAAALGARPVGRLWIGLVGTQPREQLSARVQARAEALGRRLVKAGG
jgi:putative NADPH-quinone reductase